MPDVSGWRIFPINRRRNLFYQPPSHRSRLRQPPATFIFLWAHDVPLSIASIPSTLLLYLYLFLCHQPLTLGQGGLLADHLLSSDKISRIQCKAVILPVLV